jgi:predicted metal-dependent enzyme (double-stranded beta helix superfamily)
MACRAHVDPARVDPASVDVTSVDLASVLGDLVRDLGAAFRDRAQFVPGDEYHRERVHAAPGFEVWLLSWLPGQVTPIHDHGGVVTVTTVLSGTVFEERFERMSGVAVRPTWTCLRSAGEIDPIDPTEIHRIRPIGRVVTLHLYAPHCTDGQIYQAAA